MHFTPTNMPQRNYWKVPPGLPAAWKTKVERVVESWKRKAQRHSATAQNLKFVLMCLLDDRSHTEVATEDTPNPCLALTQEGEATGEMRCSCGICKDKYTFGGERNMVALNCSHTICLSCAKHLTKPECPYCRQKITKAIRLHYEKDPYDEEEEEE